MPFAAAALLTALACGGVRVPAPALAERVQSVEGGTFLYHPRGAPRVTVSRDLGDAGVLFLDEAGGRNLRTSLGALERASMGTPDVLVDFVRDGAGFWFLGRSGTLYRSETPLGDFVEQRRADRALVRAALRTGTLGPAVVAVDPVGGLFESSGDGHFRALDFPGVALDVASLADGALVVLGLPEALFVGTTSSGFRRLPVEPLGALGFSRYESDWIVRGLLGERRLTSTGLEAFVRPSDDSDRPLPVEWARATAVQVGSASLSGGHFVEVKREAEAVILRLGDYRGPLTTLVAGGLADCRLLRSTFARGVLHVLCVPREGGGIAPRLEWWSGPPTDLARRPLELRGNPSGLVFAALADGGLLLSGICPPKDTAQGCAARGVFRLGAEGAKAVPLFGIASLHGLHGTSDGGWVAAFTRRGDSALMLAFGRESSVLWSRPLTPLLPKELVRGAPKVSLSSSEGEIAVVVEGEKARSLVLFSAAGELLSRAVLPVEIDALGAVGPAVLAVDEDTNLLFESLDGGLTFRTSPLPRALCERGDRTCRPTLACDEVGCLLGDELVRVGRGGAGARASLVAPLDVPRSSIPALRLRVNCRVERALGDRLDHVAELPSAFDARLGGTDWVLYRYDANTGFAESVTPRTGSLAHGELFAPLRKPEEWAFGYAPQVEGAAFVRYRVPSSSTGRLDLSDLEVAWDNRVAGISGRATLGRSVRSFPGDFESRSERTQRARPGLLSIAGEGVFLRVHPGPAGHEPSFFFRRDGVDELKSPPWPEALLSAEQEMFSVDGAPSFANWFGGGRVLARAAPGSAGTVFSALTLGLVDSEERELSDAVGIAYRGRSVGLLTTLRARGGAVSRATFVPLGREAFGTEERAPLFEDLGRSFEPCSRESEEGTTRVVSTIPETHLVEVRVESSTGETMILGGSRSVVFGSLDRPCLGALEANGSTTRADGVVLRALYFPRAKGRGVGYFFREERHSGGESDVSVSELVCVEDDESDGTVSPR